MLTMHPRWKWTAGLLILTLALASCRASSKSENTTHGPRLVLIIRHAEKPAGDKDPNLTKRGYERADALAKVIPDRFVRPDFLIATKESKSSNRPVETLTPLAGELHETIDAQYANDEFAKLAHAVLTDPKYDRKVVLIAWHHGRIPQLAGALGVSNAPEKWDPNVFDRIWEIHFDGRGAMLKDVPENALPGDSEK